MCGCNRRAFIWGGACLGAAGALATGAMAAQQPEKPTEAAPAKARVYTCPPCGCPNDGKEFPAPGDCSFCSMPLVEKQAAPPAKPDAAQADGRPAGVKAPVEPKPAAEPPGQPSPKL